MSFVWLRYARNFFLVFLLIVVLLFSLTPLAVRQATVYWLEQQHLTAHFHYLELSPLRGYVTLYDVKGENADGRGFAIEELHLAWNWRSLLQRRVEITDLTITGLHADVAAVSRDQMQMPVWEVAGLVLPEAGADTEDASSSSVPMEPWSVQLPKIEFNDVSLCVYDDRFDSTHAQNESHAAPLCLSWAKFGLSGDVTQLALPSIVVELPGGLSISALALQNPETNSTLASMAALQLRDLQFQQDGLSFQVLSLLGISLLPSTVLDGSELLSTNDQIRWDAFSIHQAAVSASLLSAEKTELQGFQAIVVREAGGQMLIKDTLDGLLKPWQSLLTSMTAAESEPAPEQLESTESTAAFFLNNIQISDSRLVWIDKQTSSQVSEQITDFDMTLGPIDSRQPQQPTELTLQAVLGDHGQLQAEADIKPFTKKLNAKGQIKLSALDLQPVSPYSEQAISYKVRQGLLSQTLDFNVIDDEIDAMADLKFQKFYLDQLAQAETTGSEGDVDLPIGTALNLLRDSDNNIPLQLPIKGTVGEPSVSPNYIIGVVAKKALTQAVIQYYGPFGLISIAKVALDTVTKLRFESLHFAPTDSDLSAANKKQLAKLVELLTQRPQLSLVFCAAANYSDWQPDNKLDSVESVPQLTAEQRQPLIKLAQRRNNTVKTWLLDKGVLPEQVVTCNPTVNLRSLGAAEMTVSL